MPEHIKMPPVTPIARYLADGEQTVFSYPFPIFASEDLAVYLDGARQIAGFTVGDAGETGGGEVTFDLAPEEDTVVTLERLLPIERVTDFLEGGDFSAQAINNELDYLVAAIQQVARENDVMLRYGDHETPGNTELPARSVRANKALGFDGDGNPVAVSLEGSMAAPDFTAQGTGAATRTSSDKFGDLISVKDFGAVGDGLSDDTTAIQNALAAHGAVLIPEGEFLISSTISVPAKKSMIGLGQKSVIKCQSSSFDAIELAEGYCELRNFRIEGGAIGIHLRGRVSECVQNSVSDVQIIAAATGIVLDGYNDGNKPCYWNNFARVFIERPTLHGVHLKKTGAGDTPNANKFHNVRVYSKGASTTGSGFYVEKGALNNAFIDCEANMNGDSAHSCFRVGANASDTLIVNLLTEGWNVIDNLRLENGSVGTTVINLSAQSNGAAIHDLSGGQYDAFNAGYPYKSRLRNATIADLKADKLRHDPLYTDTTGMVSLDPDYSVHLVSSYNGAVTVELPNAEDANGVVMTVKKIDISTNKITIIEDDGNGPDGKTLFLGAENDYVTMISNGAEWFVTASNRGSQNIVYADTTGTYDIDMAYDIYLLSSYNGALTARLPPADAVEAINRVVTIKKTDVSANDVTVTEQGGPGPDYASQILGDQYDAITIASNGAQWYVLSRYPS